jgi:arginyl-tRNA synthetase
MDIFAHLRGLTVEALQRLLPELPPEAFARVVVEPPRDAAHGDMATNAALVVGKLAKLAPPRLAADLAAVLSALPEVAEAAPAGPGFVNIRLREDFIRAQLPAILAAGEGYGQGAPKPGRVNLEYVSANPTGPMHVGHCRGAVVGDALAGLLDKAGFDVTREYYVNDAGAQVQALAWACFWRYLEALPPGTHDLWPDGAEAPRPPRRRRGALRHLAAIWRRIPAAGRRGAGRAARHSPAGTDAGQSRPHPRFAVEAMLTEIRADLAALGVRHDVFVSEAAMIAEGKLEQAEAGAGRTGPHLSWHPRAAQGQDPRRLGARGADAVPRDPFGDEVDRALRKSDGSGTYFANDIANHLHKLERGFTQLLHVWGADHGGYVRRMQAAVAALSRKAVPLDVVLTQIVHVVKDGQPVRMSKRAGTYVALADLIEEVGKDAVRFTMLTRKSDAQMEFDLDLVVQQSRDNPVFYVQYAHARARSVLRAGGDPAADVLAQADLSHLNDPGRVGADPPHGDLAACGRIGGAGPRTAPDRILSE